MRMRNWTVRALMITCIITATMIVGVSVVNATTYHESENNDTMGAANYATINTGDQITGSCSKEDPDFFVFTLNQGSVIHIISEGEAGNEERIFYKFYDAKDVSNDICDDGNIGYNKNLGYCYENSTHALAKGTYYLKLYMSRIGAETNSYKMKFETTPWTTHPEPNTLMGNATQLLPGDFYKGLISCGDGNDYYKVSLDKKTEFTITIKNYVVPYAHDGERAVGFETLDFNGDSTDKIIYYDGRYTQWGDINAGKQGTMTVTFPKGSTWLKLSNRYPVAKYSIKAALTGTSISKVKPGKKSLTVKWKQKTGVTGYEIQYSNDSRFESGVKTETVQGEKIISKTIKGLKAKKKYYVKVRAYKVLDGQTYYSKWSKVKSAKIK